MKKRRKVITVSQKKEKNNTRRKGKEEEKKVETTNEWCLTREDMDLLRKGNLKREAKSHLTVAQNAVWTKYIKAKIDKPQQNIMQAK